MTLNQIVSDIRNIATSGSNPVDFRIDDSQIAFWIDEVRSVLIAQAIQKRPNILNDTWLQPITCLALEQVDKSECCSVATGCMILRTVLELPDTVDNNADNLIIRVEDNMGNIISRSNNFESKYSQNTKYSKQKAKWIFKNNHIYILDNDFLSSINVIGIWERPKDLSNFVTCDGTTCFSANSEYPCSLKMATTITDMVLKDKVYKFIQLPRDISNDASNTFPTPNTKNI